MKNHINAISNGQGAPSTYLVVLAGEGKIPATASITADTGWENDMLWSSGERSTAREYFDQVTGPLCEGYGIEPFFVRVRDKNGDERPPLPLTQTHGPIQQVGVQVVNQLKSEYAHLDPDYDTLYDCMYEDVEIPIFTNRKHRIDLPLYGSNGGQLRQTCTEKYKVRAIRQQLRRMGAQTALTHLGLTLDEVHRMKGSDKKWHQHYYPLIATFQMYRAMVHAELAKRNIPWLVSTECDGCPHKGRHRWLRTGPETIQELTEFEAQFGGEFFLTDQRVPLPEALNKFNDGQLSFFDSCDGGYCGN